MMPRHFTLVNGKLAEKNVCEPQCPHPKTVNYVHSVRILSGEICNHEDQIKQMRKKYSEDLTLKDGQIQELKTFLQIKEKELMTKSEEIEALKFLTSLKDYSSNESKDSCSYSPEDSGYFKLGCCEIKMKKKADVKEVYIEKQNEQVKKVKEQMRNTQKVLKNITDILNQPKKKYQFYNSNLNSMSSKESRESCKLLDETSNNIMSETRNNMMSETSLFNADVESECSEMNLSLNMSENISQDTNEFYEYAISDHKQLKQHLISLEMKTKLQIEEMKSYYENEIRYYVELLGEEKQKNDKFRLHSTRINMLLENDFDIEKVDISQSESFFQVDDHEDQEENLLTQT